jgi:hypothetical protein
MRGVLQGQSSAQMSRELRLTYKTVLRLQANAERLQPETPLRDKVAESDELFQNAGEERR